MEVSKLEDNGNVIKEVSSSLSSSSSEFEKDVGSAHVIQKSSSMEAEECSRMISQSVSEVSTTRVTSSVVKQSSTSQSFSSTTSSSLSIE